LFVISIARLRQIICNGHPFFKPWI
jgi:hypothetical protein